MMNDTARGSGKPGIKREKIRKRNVRPDRGERIARIRESSLRDDIVKIDQDILRLLLKRYNLAAKISQKGRMSAADEKYLREKWQASVARISKDADLSSRFFALMQDVSFLPKPGNAGEEGAFGTKRSAFIFNLVNKSMDFSLNVPADAQDACSWVYMAAASGQSIHIESGPDNSPARNCLNALVQMGAKITRENGIIDCQAGMPMGQPDKVLFAGDSEFNFYLFLAHYLGKPSRVKITGEKELNVPNFAFLNHFLPRMGARLVHVVPRSGSFPVRLECSGLLPEGITASSELPPQFYEALLLASPFYERPFSIDFKDYPNMDEIFERSLPILEQCGAIYTVDGSVIGINPTPIKIPARQNIAMDPVLAGFLLLLPMASGGRAELKGFWPNWRECRILDESLTLLGQKLSISQDGISLQSNTAYSQFNLRNLSPNLLKQYNNWQKAIITSLAVCSSLRNKETSLPWPEWAECQDFLRACGFGQEEDGKLFPLNPPKAPFVWNAPNAVWVLALAVCACARSEKSPCMLGNPNIVSEIWIPFWTWYNNMLRGETDEPVQQEETKRRRIRTTAEAVIPELKEDPD